MIKILILGGLIILLSTFNSCNNDDFDEIPSSEERIEKYLADNNIDAEFDPRGFYYRPLVTNQMGKLIESGDIGAIYYELSRLDQVIIESLEEGDGLPVKFRFGNEQLLPVGLEFGLSMMRVGETYEFYLTHQIAYGNLQFGEDLPAFSPVIFTVTLDNINDNAAEAEFQNGLIETYIEEEELDQEDILVTDTGLRYFIMVSGDGDHPVSNDRVKVNYTGKWLDGDVFDTSYELVATANDILDPNRTYGPFTFTLGTGQVIKGWDEGIKLSRKGEKAILILPSMLAYPSNLTVLPMKFSNVSINPFDVLVFEIELVDIE